MIFYKAVKQSVLDEEPFFITFYGPSTTSVEFVFPNWAEIIRFALKRSVEEESSLYQIAYWYIQTSNFGLNGATSRDLRMHFDKLVTEKKPRMIFLNSSKNDPFLDIPLRETKRNTEWLIERCLALDLLVVYTTSVPSKRDDLNKKIMQYVELDRRTAQGFQTNDNLRFVDYYDYFHKKDIEKSYSLISPSGNEHFQIEPGEVDPIHFNRYGNALVAKILLKEIFGIDFDHNKFLNDLKDDSKKYPGF